MNKKQKEILEDRKKVIGRKSTGIKVMLLGGGLLTLSLIGAPIGIPIIIVCFILMNGYDKEICSINLQLEG